MERNDPCWCQSQKKWKKCHYPLLNPQEEDSRRHETYIKTYGIYTKSPEEILKIRKACQLAAHILDRLCTQAQAGITTNELDLLSVSLHKLHGAVPAPLGYGTPPFPKSICTSINDVICHGIPNDIPLKEGDILNIDVTCILDGYYGDCSRMVCIGQVNAEKEQVVRVSQECLMKGISILKPGLMLCEIGRTIESHATRERCSVVNQFVGHGTGIAFHEPPQVPHHYNNLQIPLCPGMIFTVEPMINAGRRGAVIDPIDHWTARTEDGKPSAQWEHTVLITQDGYEILTQS